MTTKKEWIKMVRAEGAGLRVQNGVIRSPGKFEGEPVYAPVLWSMILEGGLDDEVYDGDTPIATLTVDREFRMAFPQYGLDEGDVVAVWESDQGFVNTRVFPPTKWEEIQSSFADPFT